ncbi:response regulator [Oceanobacter mangrovi]|uniref:response regulator n=1 Tax=Oceanobacter mangrovi TaxID=2862510 RepID=UPI001C8E4E91|nr:response regulator [Oceanobacter mangrovi]
MKAQPHILLVDDSRDDIALLMNQLVGEYRVNAVLSGQACLQWLQAGDLPNLIVLDVSMPELDGYETCREIRSDSRYDDIDVIFLSANTSTEEKLMGLEAGAVDYITKPFNSQILLNKIHNCLQRQQQTVALQERQHDAFQTAMTALTNAGELGIVLDFMKQLNQVTNMTQLGQQIVDCIGRFGCHTVLQIRHADSMQHFSSSSSATALEQELLHRLQGAGRIVERGQRAIFNFQKLSLLVKNMPANEDLRGRYRDHIPTILEGVQPKLEALVHAQQSRYLIERSRAALQRFEQANQQHRQRSRAILERVLGRLHDSFLSWGLEETQENLLMTTVERGVDEIMDLEDASTTLEQDLQTILDAVNKL